MRILRPSHAHTAFSATVVLMASTFLSRIFGLVRNMYIAWVFGRGMEADAFLAAFQLPDMISYFLVGGAASITFVTILTRYRDTGREEEGTRSLSVILTTMFLVLGGALVLAEIFAPWYVRWWFSGFDAKKAALCVSLTRILLPAQLFFFAGGVFGAVLLVRKQFTVQAVTPLIYNLGTIVGGILLVKRLGISSLAIGTVAGALVGPFLLNAIFARRAGVRYRPILDWHDEGLHEWVRLSLPLMVGVSLVTADNWIIAHFASNTSGAISLMTYAKQLFTAPMSMLAQAAGAASMPFFASLWAKENRFEFASAVADSVSRVTCMGLLAASGMIALGKPANRSAVCRRALFNGRCSGMRRLFCGVFDLVVFVVGAVDLLARVLCGGKHFCADGGGNDYYRDLAAHLRWIFPRVWGDGTGVRIGPGDCAADTDHCFSAASAAHGVAGEPRLSRNGAMPGCGLTGGAITWMVFSWMAGELFPRMNLAAHHRLTDLAVLVAGGLLWGGITLWVLTRTGSALPKVMMKRLRLA